MDKMRKPDFIIIGAMKCATCSLHKHLNGQDGIFVAPRAGELNFFSDDKVYANGIEWYLSFFKDEYKGICGERSTHYTKLPTYPKTIGRMKELLPSIKLIYIMRHPIDRLISHYVHIRTERISSININDAITKYPQLIHYGLYALQLKPYIESYGKDRILPVFFERLVEWPKDALDRIYKFIGYTKKSECNQLERINTSAEKLKYGFLMRVFLKNRPLAWIGKNMIPNVVKNVIGKISTPIEKLEIRPKQKDILINIFDKDLAILGSWLGVELSCDNFKEITVKRDLEWKL